MVKFVKERQGDGRCGSSCGYLPLCQVMAGRGAPDVSHERMTESPSITVLSVGPLVILGGIPATTKHNRFSHVTQISLRNLLPENTHFNHGTFIKCILYDYYRNNKIGDIRSFHKTMDWISKNVRYCFNVKINKLQMLKIRKIAFVSLAPLLTHSCYDYK